MKHLTLIGLIAAAAVAGTAAPTGRAAPGPIPLDRTAHAAIQGAYESGAIGRDRMILLKAYSLYAPRKLPARFRGEAPGKCGYPVAREIGEALPDLSVEVARQIRDLRTRPSNQAYTDSEHFRIHYDTSGPATIYGWPDTSYRDAVSAAAELSWRAEVDTLDFRPPPDDSADPDGGGGSPHYDIYVQDLGTSYYGFTQPTYTVESTPLRRDATSYVVIDNDYAGFGYPDPTIPMTVTVAHEFNHACQFSHDYMEELWYMECTAVWAEDVVYDGVNDYYIYLQYYLGSPYRSLNHEAGLAMYGSCVWNHFLAHRIDASVVPGIWYECESYGPTYTAINGELSSLGTSLEDEFKVFAVWNWFTGSRDDGNHYEEGASWPLVPPQATFDTYPVTGGGPMSAHRPDAMAYNYIHLSNPGGSEEEILISYDGPGTMTVSNYALVNTQLTGGATAEHGEIELNGWGNGEIVVAGWDSMSTVCVVAVNASTTDDDMDYLIDAELTPAQGGSFYAAVIEPLSVELRWTLPQSGDPLLLNILRATSEGQEFKLLNDDPLAPDSTGSFIDTDVCPGDELWYRLVATMPDGSEERVGPESVHVAVEGELAAFLGEPNPNPFRDRMTLEFSVPHGGADVALRVFDVAGRLVATLADEWMGSGRHERSWDGTDRSGRCVAAGVYCCLLERAGARRIRKTVLLR